MTPPLSKQSPCPRQAASRGPVLCCSHLPLLFNIRTEHFPLDTLTKCYHIHILPFAVFIIIFFVRLSFHRWLAVIIMSPMSPSIIRHKTSLQLILTRSYVEFPKTKHSDFLMFLFPKPLSTCVGNCGCWRPAAELTNANHHKTAAEPN